MHENVFQPLNDFFDHIYVITLTRARERQHKIAAHLEGLDYSFFFGADKNDFSIVALQHEGIYDEQKAKDIHRYHKPMTGGQIGCSWSHRLVYEDILKNGYGEVLILEDDVTIAAGISIFTEVVNELPGDWELLYFDYHKNIEGSIATKLKQQAYHIQKLVGGLKWSHQTIDNLYAKGYSPHLKKAGYHMYTSAYAITATAAKKLLQMQTPIAYIADDLLAHAVTNNVVKGFISVPKLFTQESQGNKTSGSYVED
jgi:glycosyl transferase, family 25